MQFEMGDVVLQNCTMDFVLYSHNINLNAHILKRYFFPYCMITINNNILVTTVIRINTA